MLQLLDAAALRRWAEACVLDLTTHCAEINALNVFPVADADTGTNLLHTMRAGLDEMLRASAEVRGSYSASAGALARGEGWLGRAAGRFRHGDRRNRPVAAASHGGGASSSCAHRRAGGGSAEQAYEVMYLLDHTSDQRVQTLRGQLNAIGDSVIIVADGDGLCSVHTHCNDVGAAVESGVIAGRPHRITVVRFGDSTEQAVGLSRPTRERALLALVVGAGVADLFAAEGAAVLRCDGTTVDDATVRAAIERAGAGHVTVLPNGVIAAAALSEAVGAIRRAGQGVTLLPTSSPVQGLAALAVHDPACDSEDDTLAMAEAATATRRGAVRIATEQALTWVGRCEPGDVLGLLDDEVVLIARGENVDEHQSDVVRGLLDRMLDAGGELVTVLTRLGMDPGLPTQMEEHIDGVHPGIELVLYPGGLPDDVLLLGVE